MSFSNHQMPVPVCGGGSEVNKFELVSSVGHQMSLAWGPVQWGPMSKGWSLYSGVPCPDRDWGRTHFIFLCLPFPSFWIRFCIINYYQTKICCHNSSVARHTKELMPTFFTVPRQTSTHNLDLINLSPPTHWRLWWPLTMLHARKFSHCTSKCNTSDG